MFYEEMQMSNVKVFVLSHDEKSLDIALNNINEQTKYKNVFVPVLCGEKNKEFFTPEKYPNVLRDNTNNRFSAYNKYFNEITAMYWLAKNYDLPDYVGISHYRRILPLNDEIMSWLENPRQIVVFDGFSDREKGGTAQEEVQ